MADIAFFDRMVPDLKSRGMTDSSIELARRCWTAAPHSTTGAWPCPICVSNARQGALMPRTVRGDKLVVVRCSTCGEAITLSSL